MKIYTSDEFKKGHLLAQGVGVDDMMNKSYQRKLTEKNSILEVDDENDLSSKWRIYAKIKK